MGEGKEIKFGIETHKLDKGTWSFGSGLTYYDKQFYLFFNLIKFSIFIGWMTRED